MSDVPPPEQPGTYADAHGAWWHWDGARWSPAHGGPPAVAVGSREQERTHALLMWILYLVLGGWVVALVFYVISKDRPFVRHHAAEALNLTLVLLVPQVVAFALLVPGYVDLLRSLDETDPSFRLPGTFWAGVGVLVVLSIVNLVLGAVATLKAHRGEWWRLPIGLHPVRGVLGQGEAPPYDVGT